MLAVDADCFPKQRVLLRELRVIRLSVIGFLPLSIVFDPGIVHVRFMVGRVAVREVFIAVFPCFPASINPTVLHI
jgi:hypothetical protein